MSDNIENVKEAIRDFVVNQLTDSGNGFNSYFPTPNKQIYYAWTRLNERSSLPYVVLDIESEESLGYGTFNSYSKDGETLYRIDKEFYVITVGFNFHTMRDDSNGLNGLEAQNLSYKMARFIRRKLKSDDALSWFPNKTNDDNLPIGVESQNITDILYLPDYEDTKVNHRHRFTCSFNWQDIYQTEIDIAQGALITEINEQIVNIEITPT